MRAALLFFVVLAGACGVNQTPQPEPPPSLPSCVPDRDGAITADELPIAYGATLPYYASPGGVTRSVELGGPDRTWDLSEELRDDLEIALGPTQLGSQWYAGSFPAGAFATDAGNGLDGSTPSASGGRYRQGDGIALEPQLFPDTPNHPGWPSAVLLPDQTYRASIEWRFVAATS